MFSRSVVWPQDVTVIPDKQEHLQAVCRKGQTGRALDAEAIAFLLFRGSDTYMFFAAVFGRLSPSLSLLSYHASRKATATLYFPASGVLLGPTCFGTCCWAEVPAEFLPGSPGDNSSLFVTASKTECLNLTMTEVVKRQNSKSKKSFNQVTQIMVLLHLVTGAPQMGGKQGKRRSLRSVELSVTPWGILFVLAIGPSFGVPCSPSLHRVNARACHIPHLDSFSISSSACPRLR